MATWFVRRPPPPPPEDQPVAVALVVGLLGAVLLAVLLRRLFRPTSTAHLQAQLTLAEARVLALRNQLSDSSSAARAQPFGTEAAPEQKVVRIWMDGAFGERHRLELSLSHACAHAACPHTHTHTHTHTS